MKGFYSKFKEEKKKQELQEEMRTAYDIPENRPIVINNRSNKLSRFFFLLIDFIGTVFKIVLYIIAIILSSIGLTAIINQSTRELLMKIFLP